LNSPTSLRGLTYNLWNKGKNCRQLVQCILEQFDMHSQLHSNGLIFNSLWEDHKPDHPAGLNANYAGRIPLWREQWWVFCFVIPMLTVSGFQLMCHVAGCWRHIQFWNSVAQYSQTNLQVSSKKYCQWSNSRVNKDQVWYTSNSMWVFFSGLCWLQELFSPWVSYLQSSVCVHIACWVQIDLCATLLFMTYSLGIIVPWLILNSEGLHINIFDKNSQPEYAGIRWFVCALFWIWYLKHKDKHGVL
jgi:hypothetical protein